MGATSQLIRLTPASYGDGQSELATGTDPVAISRIIFDQDGLMPSEAGLSDLFVSWGQFVDHDLSHTPDASGELVFAPGLVAPLERSVFDPATGSGTPREQINTVTPAMDGSMIYGSDPAREALLRSYEGGRLSESEGGLPLLTESGMAGAGPGDQLFLAGDVRANENTGLTSLHIVFAAEHNYWADRISAHHADWDDEAVFQAARSIVEFEIQKITYDDWLPHLVGGAVGPDTGRDAGVDGRISTEFSTAGFRFGHTMVSPFIGRIEENGDQSANGDIAVRDAFFNISEIRAHGIDDILRGLTEGRAQMSDAVLIDDLNFFLESPAGVSGFSLAALNVLRGRDHGLGTYVEVRAALLGDLDPATLDPADFSIITSDKVTQEKLSAVYGSVLDVDLWVGGLAEDDIGGGQLGALFTHIVADQFSRTRAADAGFGEIDPALDPSLLAGLGAVSLGDIITRTTGVQYTQEDVFAAANRIGGDEGRDWLRGTKEADLMLGFGGGDYLRAGRGDDAVYGGAGADCLHGNRGDDALYGESGNDRIYGGRGNDRIDGGAGRDHLNGGRGDDVFVFKLGNGMDMISGFNARGNDVIEISGFGISSFEELKGYAEEYRWKLSFDLGGDRLDLRGTQLSDLSEADFLFV